MVTEKTVELGWIDLIFGGDSLWSDAPSQNIRVSLSANYFYDGEVYENVQLNAYFDTSDWNVSEKGLIYTDKIFERMLNEALLDRGYPKAYYSEQGMQGNNYVNFDWEKSDKLMEKINETN